MTNNILVRMSIIQTKHVYKNRIVASFQVLKNQIIKLLLSCITKIGKLNSNYIYKKDYCFSSI